MRDKAICLLSGGQDSTTAYFWAKKIFSEVKPIFISYGQKHDMELNSAIDITEGEIKVFKVDILKQLGGSTLMGTKVASQTIKKQLAPTFVPGRNILFLTIAASYAYQQEIENIVIGVNAVDYSGYPDCRAKFIHYMQGALRLGLDYTLFIHTPLIDMNKKEIVLLAKELNIIDLMKYTHTCYEGQRPPCGKCAACIIRAKGFKEAGIKDPLTGE